MKMVGKSGQLRGIELRYALTKQLFDGGSATVPELVDALRADGFEVAGRASKCVSDALRWEIEHCRVYQLGRGYYGPGWMPRSTEHRIWQRVQALRAEVKRCRSEAGSEDTPGPR